MIYLDYDQQYTTAGMYRWWVNPMYISTLNTLDGFIGIFDVEERLLYNSNHCIPAAVSNRPAYLGFRDEDTAIIAKLSL